MTALSPSSILQQVRRLLRLLDSRYSYPQQPFIVREGWVANNYHVEEGRGSYYPVEAGTSEAQCLMAQALGLWHQLGLDCQTRPIAWQRCLDLLDSLGRGPHWTYAAKGPVQVEAPVDESNVLASGAWNIPATFVNGVASVTFSQPVRRIFRVLSTDAVLQHRALDAPLLQGTEWFIENVDISEDELSAEITLTTSYSGAAHLVLAYWGEIAPLGSWLHYYPIRRRTIANETIIAADSLMWMYDACVANGNRNLGLQCARSLMDFQRLYQPIYVSSTLMTLPPYEYNADVFSLNSQFPLSVSLMGNTTQNLSFVLIKPGLSGNLRLKYQISSQSGVPFCVLERAADYQWFTLILPQSFDGTIPASAFYQSSFIDWRPNYGYSTYSDPNSQVTITPTVLNYEPAYTFTCDPFEVYAGVVLFRDPRSSAPTTLQIQYTATQPFALRFRDADDWNWFIQIPAATSATRYNFDFSEVQLDYYQTNTGTPPAAPVGVYQEVQIIFQQAGSVTLNYLGNPVDPLAAGVEIRGVRFGSFTATTFEIEIEEAQLSQALPDYEPWTIFTPFTIEYRYNTLMAWRAPFYLGYQCPWLHRLFPETQYQEAEVLNLIEQAQDDFFQRTGVDGPVTPIYAPPATEWSVPETFTWDGPDPNTIWPGFQYRLLENVARLHAAHPSQQTEQILLRFLQMFSQGIPTEFPKDAPPIYSGTLDSYSTALLFQALLYMRFADLPTPIYSSVFRLYMHYLQRHAFLGGGLMYGYAYAQLLTAAALYYCILYDTPKLNTLFLNF